MKGKSNCRKNRKHRSLTILIIIALFLILYCAVTYFLTPLFIIQPQFNEDIAGLVLENPEISPVTLEGKYFLSGYLLDRDKTDRLIIYFGGRSEDAAENMLLLKDMENSLYGEALKNYDIASIDWPRYGKSEGRATDQALREAAKQIVDRFDSDYGYEEIVLLAYSLGTGPALYAASECECEKVILIAPYASAVDLYNTVTPVFYGPMVYLLGFKMPAAEYAKTVNEDTLIIACPDDERVPFDSSVQLSESFMKGNKNSFVEINGVDHGGLPRAEETIKAICEYLKD